MGSEAVIRVLTLALQPLGDYSTVSVRQGVIDISAAIGKAADFADLCALFGYNIEEHVVQTGDGYMLGIHRIPLRKGEKDQPVNHGMGGLRKNVVYLHHGLLMNSEVWVCLTDEQRCLPFRLVEQGYDVWLGNNRGNKYSKKNLHLSPSGIPFWDFSMDQFAFHDIPDTIQYILQTTSAKSLSYIGFSQGTAQAFATLAINPKLNEQVNVFIGLAPAMSPAGLSNYFVDALIKASPQVLLLLFGRRSLLSSTTTWQTIFYPPIYCRLIDMALSFLFGWHVRNISSSQKLAAYLHLYSFTSTKSVVHWFQIIRTKTFHMYDDDRSRILSLGSSDRFTKVAKFPTRNIKSPIYLLYGGSDSLVDIEVMLRELPKHTVAIQVPHYEHLDFLWAREVDTLVFPHVFEALENYCEKVDSIELHNPELACHTPVNNCERPVSMDMASDIDSRRLDSSDNNSYLSAPEKTLLKNAMIETPVSSVFQNHTRYESEGFTPVGSFIGTPNGTIFQSSLPRPSYDTRKRTRLQKDLVDTNEDYNLPLSHRKVADNLPERNHFSQMTLDYHIDNRNMSTGNIKILGSKKSSFTNVRLFAGKASSVNGSIHDDVKRISINRCLTDESKAIRKKGENRIKKPDMINGK